MYDVVALGGRLLQIDPTAPDPTASVTHLEIVDDHTLRIASTTGYGSPGERLVYTFDGGGDGDGDGDVVSIRGGSGTTAYPYERYRRSVEAAERVTLGGAVRV